MQAKDAAFENLQHSHLEVKSDSSISYDFYDDEFATFEKHATGIGSKLMKEMGYQGNGLGIKGQGIINPIKVKELSCHAGLRYTRKELGESSNIASNQPITDDEILSSQSSDSEGPMNTCQSQGKAPQDDLKILEEKESL